MKKFGVFLILFFITESCYSTKIYKTGNVYLELDQEIRLNFNNKKNDNGLEAIIKPKNSHFKENEAVENCLNNGQNEICLDFGKSSTNTPKIRISDRDDGPCTIVELDWVDSFCVNYTIYQWYGSIMYTNGALWPIQAYSYVEQPYIIKTDAGYGHAVEEAYWFNSNGYSIYIDPSVPLLVNSRQEKPQHLCFFADNKLPPYNPDMSNVLRAEFCQYNDAVDAHKNAINKYWQKPTGLPDEILTRYPSYYLFKRYTVADASNAVSYVNEVLNNGFDIKRLVFPIGWESCYGSMDIDIEQSTSMIKLTGELAEKGVDLAIEVHPFIMEECEPHYQNAVLEGRFVVNITGGYLVPWNNVQVGVVDLTNDTTAAWWKERVNEILAAYAFKGLDGKNIEVDNLPATPILNGISSLHPNVYINKYLETLNDITAPVTVNTRYRNQQLPIITQILPKSSANWDNKNGLIASIIHLFHYNFHGYMFTQSDQIGGGAAGNPPTKELYIRWLQASLFLPSLQFSVLPWDYDNETVEIARNLLDIRARHYDLIQLAMEKAVSDGTPVNAPIWWIAPDDKIALACNDEYLLGETLLVAPIIYTTALNRDIYLPKGFWRDYTREPYLIVEGPRWLYNQNVSLSELAYFIKEDNPGCNGNDTTILPLDDY